MAVESPVELTILMPVRNEGINLPMMLRVLKAVVGVSHEVLIVYDRQDDDSAPVVEATSPDYPNLRALHNTTGEGVLNAIRAGVHAARGRCVLIFAADEVGPVMAIDDMLALINEGCDFVSCTRYAYGGRRLGGSWIGGVLSRLANWLFCRITRFKFTDATTGIKLFRREVFDELDLQARPVGWAVAFEMAIKAQLAGLTLGEVPIVSIDRLYGGKSTFSVGPWFVEYLRWFIWGFRQSLARRGVPAPKIAVRVPKATAMGCKVQM